MTANREREVTETFVSLATTLAEGYDVLELLSGLTADCSRILDIASAGLLLADRRERLHVLAASSEETRALGSASCSGSRAVFGLLPHQESRQVAVSI
jgi:uncharacterized protein YigA (DUF484 family)